MPNESDRKKALKDLERHTLIAAAAQLLQSSSGKSSSSSSSGDSDESSDEDNDFYLSPLFIFAAVSEMRFLATRGKLPKSTDFREAVIPRLDSRRFRQLARMTKEKFVLLVSEIGENFAFCGNDSRATDSSLQLLVALYRFGRCGNGAGKVEVAQKFGISEGSVELFTRRSILGILSIENKYVNWPEPPERSVINKRIQTDYGFPDCLGMVDGTTLVLGVKPVENSEDYFTRKREYGIAAMLAVDDLRKIRYAHCGFTGSTHDSSVYSNSKLGINPANYFAGHQYIIADSAYTASMTVVPAYKKPLANLPEFKRSNTSSASLRIAVEVAICMLKGRFQSLRGLRILIRKADDHARPVYWFRTCCVLHNFLLDDEYNPDWTEEEENDLGNEEQEIENAVNGAVHVDGKAKRDYLRGIVREFRQQ